MTETTRPALLRDAILVVDIEATCWQTDPPEGQLNEIIEIGAALLDLETLTPSLKTSILVRPQQSEISPFCTELTSITPQMVEENGLEFEDACRQLAVIYDTPRRLWCSWGNYDRRIFEAQCLRTGVPYPFSSHHCNVRKLWAKYCNHNTQIPLAPALAQMGLEPQGTAHRGGDDAWNTARLLGAAIQQTSPLILKRFW
jgi:inhibitor of KinA sporulation pathway (predicted exonuclease)